MADTLHFERYEYKYFVPDDRTEELRRFIRPYTQLDEHAARAADRRYSIHSVYFDTQKLDLYHASVDDQVDRYKLRVRWYDDAVAGPYFGEVKRKVRQVIVKDRVRLAPSEAAALLQQRAATGMGSRARLDRRAHAGVVGFEDRVVQIGAVPTVCVRYTREAYESVFGEYARITFDRAMCWQRIDGTGWSLQPRAWSYVDSAPAMQGIRDAMLIELKFTRRFPRWMADLVAEFDLERRGFSKFVWSMSRQLATTQDDTLLQRVAGIGA